MSENTPTGPRYLHAFVHFDGTVTLTDPLHGDTVYTRSDVVNDLLAALRRAKNTIKAFHNLELNTMPTEQRERAWNIYDQNSPEMVQINAAIAKAEGKE